MTLAPKRVRLNCINYPLPRELFYHGVPICSVFDRFPRASFVKLMLSLFPQALTRGTYRARRAVCPFVVRLVSRVGRFVVRSPCPMSSLVLVGSNCCYLWRTFVSRYGGVFFPCFGVVHEAKRFRNFRGMDRSVSFNSRFLSSNYFFTLEHTITFYSLGTVSFFVATFSILGGSFYTLGGSFSFLGGLFSTLGSSVSSLEQVDSSYSSSLYLPN